MERNTTLWIGAYVFSVQYFRCYVIGNQYEIRYHVPAVAILPSSQQLEVKPHAQ
jgi:hypothetical protein